VLLCLETIDKVPNMWGSLVHSKESGSASVQWPTLTDDRFQRKA
jgi:hypothetical protein